MTDNSFNFLSASPSFDPPLYRIISCSPLFSQCIFVLCFCLSSVLCFQSLVLRVLHLSSAFHIFSLILGSVSGPFLALLPGRHWNNNLFVQLVIQFIPGGDSSKCHQPFLSVTTLVGVLCQLIGTHFIRTCVCAGAEMTISTSCQLGGVLAPHGGV